MPFAMPTSRFLRQAAFAGIVVFCVWGTKSDTVAAQHAPVVSVKSEHAAVRKGGEMETSRHWLDAIELYEKSLESWPDSKPLQFGLRRSKIHFSIARRYADHSFEASLLRKNRTEVLNLFDDVLYQVKANYVTPISTTSYVAHGTESFYLALANKKFLDTHLRGADPKRIANMRTILKTKFWNKPIAHRTAARKTVSNVCDLARQNLGLRPAAVVMEYVFGGCNALDDYSSYLTPDRLEDLYGNIEGEFVGLGIEMKAERGKGLLLVNVLPNSPAIEGGLHRGDYIVSVDGRNCRHITTDEAARLLRGSSGSSVRLLYEGLGDSAPRRGTFVRRAVEIKSIPIVKMVDKEKGVGYILMSGFQKSSPSEMDAALWKLHRLGMRSLIWDVRGNPGGLLSATPKVLDRFITKGVLVSTRGRTADQNDTYSAYRRGTWKMPLVLLVDGDSASASEIVAGAIRDHKRGTIVGRQTYGKWSVQSILPIRGNTGLRLTTAKFYSPHGLNLSKIGIKPDVIVERTKTQKTYYRGAGDGVDPESDSDLRTAIDILNGQYTRR